MEYSFPHGDTLFSRNSGRISTRFQQNSSKSRGKIFTKTKEVESYKLRKAGSYSALASTSTNNSIPLDQGKKNGSMFASTIDLSGRSKTRAATIIRETGSLMRSKYYASNPNLHDPPSRANIKPKGLHTHVLNCSGLRPHRYKGFGGTVFREDKENETELIQKEVLCKAENLGIRDKMDSFPHVCGKKTISHNLESSTSSDQELPAMRSYSSKKKLYRSSRVKSNARKMCGISKCTSEKCCHHACKIRDSEDSSVFSKSDSESKTSSRIPKVSISAASTEILDDGSTSYKYFHSSSESESKPLKSALKLTHDYDKNYCEPVPIFRKTSPIPKLKRHRDDNYRKSFVQKCIINNSERSSIYSRKSTKLTSSNRNYTHYHSPEADDPEIYDPSLPVIPIMIPSLRQGPCSNNYEKKPLCCTKSSSSSNANSRNSGSITSSIRSGSTDLEGGIFISKRKFPNSLFRRNGKIFSKSMSNLAALEPERTSDLASESTSDSMDDISIGSPSLSNWHRAIAMTRALGWSLLLYNAARNNYKPLQFARQLLKASLFLRMLKSKQIFLSINCPLRLRKHM